MKLRSINIYDFHDYRKFLNEIFKGLKKKKVSMRKLANLLNTTAANLSMIQNGKRNLTIELANELSNFIELNQQESNYFKNMIILNDSKDLEDKHKAYNKMKRYYAYKDIHEDSLENYQYLSNWYNVIIREMVNMNSFKWNAKWIQENLLRKVSIIEIKKAMKFLVDKKFVNINEDIVTASKHLECVGGVYKLSLSKFHDEMMDLIVESIYKVDSSKRQILGHTVAISEQEFDQAKEILNEAIEKIQNLKSNNKDDNKKVYHFSLAGVPVVK